MKERPILFSGKMVCAILEGAKTQTRRICKSESVIHQVRIDDNTDICVTDAVCPYGKVGDRLWVRETFGYGTRPDPQEGWRDGIEYRADEKYLDEHDYLPLYSIAEGIDYDDSKKGWKPSIFMPRWASRITLEIVAVRLERLQNISEDDAQAEGTTENHGVCRDDFQSSIGNVFRRNYANLWESINGYGSWDFNPFVWVITFKRIAQDETRSSQRREP